MKKTTVLVTGGAGFIGSHVSKMLSRSGFDPIVLDDLSKGYESAVKYGLFIKGNIGDENLLKHIFSNYPIKAVLHFAAFIDVGESVREPQKYYQNNVFNTITLLKTMLEYNIKHIVFSSTAAIFGEPSTSTIDEKHPIAPLNPYGNTKWIVEQILQEFDRKQGLTYSALRYFNAAGGDPEGEIKNYQNECHNLIPKILINLKREKPEMLIINGNDYPTRDGTCIRDYIHINDLGEAHIKVLRSLLEGDSSSVYNLGNGQGHSIKEVITACEAVCQCKIPYIIGKRREGDAATLLANSSKALRELQWKPRFTLHQMIEHAWHSYTGST